MANSDHTKQMRQQLQEALAAFIMSEERPAIDDDTGSKKQIAARAHGLRTFIQAHHSDNKALLYFATPEKCKLALQRAQEDFIQFDRWFKQAIKGFKAAHPNQEVYADNPEQRVADFMDYIRKDFPGLYRSATPENCASYFQQYQFLTANSTDPGEALQAPYERYSEAFKHYPKFCHQAKPVLKGGSGKREEVLAFAHYINIEHGARLPDFTDQEAQDVIERRAPKKASLLADFLLGKAPDLVETFEPPKEWQPIAEHSEGETRHHASHSKMSPWVWRALCSMALLVGTGAVSASFKGCQPPERTSSPWDDYVSPHKVTHNYDPSLDPQPVPAPFTIPSSYSTPTGGFDWPTSDNRTPQFLEIGPKNEDGHIPLMPSPNYWQNRELSAEEAPKTGKSKN